MGYFDGWKAVVPWSLDPRSCIALVENVFARPESCFLRISADVSNTISKMFLISYKSIKVTSLPQSSGTFE